MGVFFIVMYHDALLIVVIITSLPLVIGDLFCRRISNRGLLLSASACMTVLICAYPGLLIRRVLAAAAGCIFMLIVRRASRRGLGIGDIKYCSLLAFAAGFDRFCLILFIASCYGLFVFLFFIAFKGAQKSRCLPFAPCLYSALLTAAVVDLPPRTFLSPGLLFP